jgi:hypothetical protein
MQTVYVAQINDENNPWDVVLVGATKKVLNEVLAQWCRNGWDTEGDHDPEKLPSDDEEAIEMYFDFWFPEILYRINQEPVAE